MFFLIFTTDGYAPRGHLGKIEQSFMLEIQKILLHLCNLKGVKKNQSLTI